MAPGADKAEIPHHAHDKQGQGKHHADDKFTGLILDFGPACGLFRIFRFHGIIRKYGAVTGLFNGRYNIVDAGNPGDIFHGYPFRGKVHGCLNNTGDFFV